MGTAEDALKRLHAEFVSNKKVVELREREAAAMRGGDYVKACSIKSTIDRLWEEVKQNYAQSVEEDVRQMSFGEAGVPEGDMLEINELLVTMFMSIDIIDSAIRDINNVLHRTDKGLAFEMFEDFMAISNSISEKTDFFDKHTSYNKDLFWADKCDDMYNLIRNKAKSIIRKRADDGWGRNFQVR